MGNLHQADGTALVLGEIFYNSKPGWHLMGIVIESFSCHLGICYIMGEQPKIISEIHEPSSLVTEEETKRMVVFSALPPVTLSCVDQRWTVT